MHTVHTLYQNVSFLCECVSGSLLVACAHFGAYVCGTDIDYNTIHGKGTFSLHELTCHVNCSSITFSWIVAFVTSILYFFYAEIELNLFS